MDFDMNYFDGFDTTDSYIILIILFGAFLFGMLVGYLLRTGKVIRLKREVKDLKKKLAELEAQIEALKEQIDLRDADLKKASFDLEERDAKIGRLEKEKNKLYNEVYSLNSDIEKLQASNKTYTTTVEDLQDQILGLKTKNISLGKEVEKDEEEINEFAQFQSTFNATRKRLESLEGKIVKLEEENDKLKEQVEDLQDQQIQPLELEVSEESEVTDRSISESKTEDIEEDGADLNQTTTGQKIKLEDLEPEKDTVELFVPEKRVLQEKILVEETERDDLTRIDGIGPFLEKKLNEIGILTYIQIARFDQAMIDEVTKKIGYFEGRIEKDDWVGQAAKLHEQKLENPFDFAVEKSTATVEDDLKIIEGVGPKIEQLLKDAGLLSLQQVAETEVGQLRDILEAAGDRYRIHDPGTWPAQARLAANGEWELLKEYKDELKGGREVK